MFTVSSPPRETPKPALRSNHRNQMDWPFGAASDALSRVQTHKDYSIGRKQRHEWGAEESEARRVECTAGLHRDGWAAEFASLHGASHHW